MAVLETLQTLLTFLTLISVPVGVFYHIMTLKNTRKNQQLQLETRQTQLFMNIHEHHISMPTMEITFEMMWEWDWRDFDDFVEKYMYPNNKENNIKFMHYFASLERLGVLCRKGLIDPDLVYDSQPGSIIFLWEKFLPVIEEYRVRMNAPHIYADPEYLYNEMIRIRAKRGHPDTLTTDIFKD